MTKDALYGAVDPNAIRPLVVGKMQDGTYILASETCAIDVLGAGYSLVRKLIQESGINLNDSFDGSTYLDTF